MIGSDKIFFDTSPFIYLVENHPKYSQPVTDFIVNQIYLHESLFFTSTITLVEFYVKPKKNNDLVVIEKFKRKIKEFNFTVFDLTQTLAEFSSDLRAKYEFLTAFDSI
ncbi:MAG: PIN domain-containing protein [Bacteroidota bacterium]